MKRYNITIESRFNNQRRIKITSADNGEWVRYEDVADALKQETAITERFRKANENLWEGRPVEIRMPEEKLDEIVGYGGFHVEQLDKNLWFFDLAGCKFNVSGKKIKLLPIESNTWADEQGRQQYTGDTG